MNKQISIQLLWTNKATSSLMNIQVYCLLLELIWGLSYKLHSKLTQCQCRKSGGGGKIKIKTLGANTRGGGVPQTSHTISIISIVLSTASPRLSASLIKVNIQGQESRSSINWTKIKHLILSPNLIIILIISDIMPLLRHTGLWREAQISARQFYNTSKS